MATKNLLASKTVWINAAAAPVIPLIMPLIPQWYLSALGEDAKTIIATAVMAIVNIALRLVTHETVTVRRTRKPKATTTTD